MAKYNLSYVSLINLCG